MPTIKARKQVNGSTRYTAIVRIRRGTTVLHRESRTTHSAAMGSERDLVEVAADCRELSGGIAERTQLRLRQERQRPQVNP